MLIHHFRNEEGTGVETRSAVVSGIVNGDVSGVSQSTSFPGFSVGRVGENPGNEVVSQSAIGQFFPLFSNSLRSLSYIHEQLHTLFTGSHCDS